MSPVEQIKAKLSIAELVGSYIKLEKAGGNFRARCPFHHERTPSFFVSPERDTFHCFGCNKGGDIFTFVQEIEGIDFPTALAELARRAGVTLRSEDRFAKSERDAIRTVLEFARDYFIQSLHKTPPALAYLSERGVGEEARNTFQIGFAPDGWSGLRDALRATKISDAILEKSGLFIPGDRGLYDRFRRRIMFPITDSSGALVGFTGRLLPGGKDDDASAKYVNTPETTLYNKSKVVYGLSIAKSAIREAGTCVLVEGQLDVVLSCQAGIKNIVAVSGTAFTESHARAIGRFADKLCVVLDGDEAGFKASARVVSTALSLGMEVTMVPLPAGVDPADMARTEPGNLSAAISASVPFVAYVLSMLKNETADMRALHKRVREMLFPHLADMLHPLERDRALQEIAQALHVSPEALREEYVTFIKTRAPSVPTQTERAEAVLPEGDLRGRVLERLIGLCLWQSKKETPEVDLGRVRSELERILMSPERERVMDFLDDNKKNPAWAKRQNELVFQAESYYNGSHHLEEEVRHLLASLEKESLKQLLALALEELRSAEDTKDTEAVARLLARCQDISQKINLL